MHEDARAGGISPSPLPGPAEHATPLTGQPADRTPPAGSPDARPPGWVRGLLIYLAVALLAATAGMGSTLAVQHAGAQPSATRTPRDAAAYRPGAMND